MKKKIRLFITALIVKKIYLIITSMMLLLFLVACLPPTDKTTEYKEKNDEFKKHILEKLSNNINEKKYARITRGFGISGNDELSIYKYEIAYNENTIEVYNSFIYKEQGELIEKYIVYTYVDTYYYERTYSDNKYTDLISEEKYNISKEEFLQMYEHKEYAIYNLDLTDAKITKIVREVMRDGWGYQVDNIKYNIVFNKNKEFTFDILGNEFLFSECEANFYEDNTVTMIMKGKTEGKDCTATIIIDDN